MSFKYTPNTLKKLEQLFEEIKAGNVTLEALMQTGDLNSVKRTKINFLLNELEEQEEADWLRAENGGDEHSYSAYLANHPAGKSGESG
jgi:hypothetical protein